MLPICQCPGCLDSRPGVELGTSWTRCRVVTRCSVPTVTDIHSFRSSLKDTEMRSPLKLYYNNNNKKKCTSPRRLSADHELMAPTPRSRSDQCRLMFTSVWIMAIQFDHQNRNTLQGRAVREAYGMFCTQPRRPRGQWRLHTDARSACKYKRFFSDGTDIFNTFWRSSLIYYVLLHQRNHRIFMYDLFNDAASTQTV